MVTSDEENPKSVKNKQTKHEIGTKLRSKPTISMLHEKLKLLSHWLQIGTAYHFLRFFHKAFLYEDILKVLN